MEAAGCERGNGAQGRDRTTDTAIFNRMLYQLSYLGADTGPTGPGHGERRVIEGRPHRVQNPIRHIQKPEQPMETKV